MRRSSWFGWSGGNGSRRPAARRTGRRPPAPFGVEPLEPRVLLSTVVDVELRFVETPTAQDAVTVLPSSTASAEGAFYAELWIQDLGPENALGERGIAGAQLDLRYSTALLNVTEVTLGSSFDSLSYDVDDAAGLVDDITGFGFSAEIGSEPQWAKFATVRFRSTGEGAADAAVEPGEAQIARWGAGNVAWENVDLDAGSVNVIPGADAAVTGRHVFYDNSAFDGSQQGEADDDAIDPIKEALVPGQTAANGNFTDASAGLNGVMVDVEGMADPVGLSLGTIGSYFAFAVGNGDDPAGWGAAPAPSTVGVRQVASAQRVTVTWSNEAIANQWLEVTVLATEETGLSEPDVFYFGNASGDVNADGYTTLEDALQIWSQRLLPGVDDPATVSNTWDINKDGWVDLSDALNAWALRTLPGVDPGLRMIEPPAVVGGVMAMSLPAGSEPTAAPGDVGSGGDAVVSEVLAAAPLASLGSTAKTQRQATDPVPVLELLALRRSRISGPTIEPVKLTIRRLKVSPWMLNESADGNRELRENTLKMLLNRPIQGRLVALSEP